MDKKPAAARSRTYHHGDLKAAIRQEAERILIGRGVAEIGFREIARGLGVSHNAPYRHYASRETLLAELAADGFHRLEARYAQIEETDPERKLIAIGCAYIRFAIDEPAIFRLMFGPELAKPQHPELKAAADESFASLTAIVEASGAPAPATQEALTLWSLVHGLACLMLDDRIEEHGGKLDVFELVRKATESFLAGVRSRS